MSEVGEQGDFGLNGGITEIVIPEVTKFPKEQALSLPQNNQQDEVKESWLRRKLGKLGNLVQIGLVMGGMSAPVIKSQDVSAESNENGRNKTLDLNYNLVPDDGINPDNGNGLKKVVVVTRRRPVESNSEERKTADKSVRDNIGFLPVEIEYLSSDSEVQFSSKEEKQIKSNPTLIAPTEMDYKPGGILYSPNGMAEDRDINGNWATGQETKSVKLEVINFPGKRSREAFDQVVDQFNLDDENNGLFKPREGRTYCNYAWEKLMSGFGIKFEGFYHDGTNLVSNEIYDRLNKDKQDWTMIAEEKAQQMANEGYPITLAVKNEEGHGHVALLAPNDNLELDENGMLILRLVQAGDKNGTDVVFDRQHYSKENGYSEVGFFVNHSDVVDYVNRQIDEMVNQTDMSYKFDQGVVGGSNDNRK